MKMKNSGGASTGKKQAVKNVKKAMTAARNQTALNDAKKAALKQKISYTRPNGR